MSNQINYWFPNSGRLYFNSSILEHSHFHFTSEHTHTTFVKLLFPHLSLMCNPPPV
jgi:hypothetical protein